ncbi:MAG TPA: amino acid adenylation domain-containing protein [Pseudonocardiaceae bacterium]|nr:amino acid adenylation domain-containing protein [Pseudonocardiaceae bacterium]
MSTSEQVDAALLTGLPLGGGEFDEVMSLGRGLPLPPTRHSPVHELVAGFARTTPLNTAVLIGGRAITYGALEAWSGRVASRLSAAGVDRGDRVGILAEPSAAVIAAMLGILRSGAAYVPIDGAQPDQRITTMLTDAGATAMVATDAAGYRLTGLGLPVIKPEEAFPAPAGPEEPRAPSPAVAVTAEDPAYLIYTSGSTGEPKGILVEHGQLTASTLARRSVYPGAPVHLLVSPLAFDSSVAGLWGTLTAGGQLVMAMSDEVRDPERLVKLIQTHQVTRVLCVPSLYDALLDAAERLGVQALHSLQTVIVAGETLPEALVKRHFAMLPASIALVNEYGPTEATVWASYHRFDAPGPVSIGGPVPGARLYVLDGGLRPVPRGVQGELFIGGAGVSRGYVGRPNATAQAFLDDPFAGTEGARMYRTGDLVRWNHDGRLEFLGRRDHQVKIRGYRIELGAIEAALRTAPGVRDAVVVIDSERSRLTGFVLASSGVTAKSIREHLAGRLSTVMVPAQVKVLDEFPRTMNGKVDRSVLRATAEVEQPTAARAAAVPGSTRDEDTTTQVAAAWAEVLAVPDIPTDVNFFDLGGHSLAIFRLQDALELHTGTRPSIVDLFRHTTVSAQAAVIRGGGADPRAARSATRGSITGRAQAVSARRARLQQPAITTVRPTTWLRCAVAHQEPRQRLVCFPHAGGSASFFHDWGHHLPAVEVHAVCYPGRGERIEEPPATDLRRLAGEIADAVASLEGAPLALFGHSMGAAVALEAARALESRGIRLSHVFASGSRDAPCQDLNSSGVSSGADDDTVVRRLVDLGGTEPDMAADPAFQELVLPYVRADSRMFHAYTMRPGPPLHCPVTTIVGDRDVDADRRPWSELTGGVFREEIVPGDHFYLVSAPPYALLHNLLVPRTSR